MYKNLKKDINIIINDLNEKSYLYILLYVFFVGFITYGFAFSNILLSHDSLTWFNQTDDAINLKIGSGRIFQYIYICIRGRITVPWLLGVIALFFLSISTYLIQKTFEFQQRASKYLSTTLLVINYPFILLVATYIHDIDVYMLALIFAIFPVYIFKKNIKSSYIVGAMSIVIMCGLYQSYISVTILLYMFTIIIMLLNNEEPLKIFKSGIEAVGTIITGLLSYQLIIKFILADMGVVRVDSGMNFLEKPLLSNLKNTYMHFVQNFFNPVTYKHIEPYKFIMPIMLISLIYMIFLIREKKLQYINTFMLIIILLLVPFACNFIYFLSAGTEMHHLMMLGYICIYLLPIIIFDKFLNNKIMARIITYILIVIIIFNQFIMANVCFLEKDLISKSTDLTMSRIIYDIEQQEGYVANETEVVFIGAIQHSDYGKRREGFEFLRGTGIWESGIIYRYISYFSYFHNYLRYPINIANPQKTIEDIDNRAIIESMPCYPTVGYMQLIDDVLVIKFVNKYDFY